MTASTTTPEFRRIPLAYIIASSTNPRTVPPGVDIVAAWKLAPLADDIKQHGVYQPILVRPGAHPDGYELFEIVGGERRWRASQLAQMPDIPCFIRELSDFEARRLQFGENDGQEPLNPLEQARGYAGMLAAEGIDGFASVPELAAGIGKSVKHVRQCLQLLALCPEAQAAIWAGRLGAGQALPIARIPSATLQAKATAEVLAGFGGEPFSAKAAAEHVRKRYMLQLEKAPFDIAADHPSAGRCTACPKRSSAEPDLFDGEHIAGDWCRDSACWDGKVQAHHDAERAAALKKAEGAAAQPPSRPRARASSPGATPAVPVGQAQPEPQHDGNAEPAITTEADAARMAERRSAELFGAALFTWMHQQLMVQEGGRAVIAGLSITTRAMFRQSSAEAAALVYRVRGWPEPKRKPIEQDFEERISAANVTELQDLLIEIPLAEALTDGAPFDEVAGQDGTTLAYELGLTVAKWDAMVKQAIADARLEVAERLGLGKQAKARQKHEAKQQAAKDATAAFIEAAGQPEQQDSSAEADAT